MPTNTLPFVHYPSNKINRMLLFSPISSLLVLNLTKPFLLTSIALARPLTMASSHAFAGNPFKSCLKPESLTPYLLNAEGTDSSSSPSSSTHDRFLVLPLRKGRPLARTDDSNPPRWQLAWVESTRLNQAEVRAEEFVYLGSTELAGEARQCHYWSIDVSEGNREWGQGMAFVELRTLMVATDWADADSMGQLAVAGHARALLEWHSLTKFCGSCGSKMVPISAGKRKQCTNDSCKKRIYPRVDPVVIMLVIDRDNDRALLSRQLRFVPRMWSCLAGFIEPGESLEEAVRRETLEETGIEVGEVIYHSSQPWPVGPNSMPCQLMVGFFAYAKSLDIHVDKKELEDAQWHSREDVKKAITFTEYEKAQKSTAVKVAQACKGVEQGPHGFSFNDYALESGEMAPMFIPGPFAIAHHLISTWVNQGVSDQGETPLKRINSLSNL